MNKITQNSMAEYFSKNLQQVGFSSNTKAVLTTLKEAVDNSLDACEEAQILPEIQVVVRKIGEGASKNADLIEIIVEDNGPGVEFDDLARVFGQYLASSKFGRGRCTRGQQGIGISAATTWAQLTHASGVSIVSKTSRMKKAILAVINVNIKANKGVVKKKESFNWFINGKTKKEVKKQGLKVRFHIDGRIQLNGDGGLLTYLEGISLVNPHMSLSYALNNQPKVKIQRVSQVVPLIPPSILPHPHTMKLGEFIAYSHLYEKISLKNFLKKAFSRVTDKSLTHFVSNGLSSLLLNKSLIKISKQEFKHIFQTLQKTELHPPSARSVLIIGEDGLSKSIQRLGVTDFFSVITRKPRICDFKPVVVEVAIARLTKKKKTEEEDGPIQLLRFANRVPLQFDKASCAITKSVESVQWRSYGLSQPKGCLPVGPYVFAVSVTSPFIKFKNASKETIEASEELVDEIRKALMKAGQKLSRHLRHESKALHLERKIQHIEKFAPLLVKGLSRIVKASSLREKRAEKGLIKLLGRDTKEAEKDLKEAELAVKKLKEKEKLKAIQNKEEENNEKIV